jgi:Holliday junction resolvase
MAKTYLSRKAKGRNAELNFAQLLRDYGIDKNARRQPLSGATFMKGDINTGCGYCVEVKNQEKLNIWDALKQAEKQAGMEQQPFLLAFKRNHTNFYVAMSVYDWIDLYKRAEEPNSISEPTRELRFELEKLREIARRVIKKLKSKK